MQSYPILCVLLPHHHLSSFPSIETLERERRGKKPSRLPLLTSSTNTLAAFRFKHTDLDSHTTVACGRREDADSSLPVPPILVHENEAEIVQSGVHLVQPVGRD